MTADPGTENQWSGPIPQAELVQYQSGSVVSRTLIKKPTGTVTAFAFDAGEALSEHTSPFETLILILDGEGEIAISGVAHRVKAADAVMLPAHQPHAVKALSKFKMILVMIRAKDDCRGGDAWLNVSQFYLAGSAPEGKRPRRIGHAERS